MVQLVIFDLDGTLLNSVADLGQATNIALKKHDLPTHELDCYKYFVGNGVSKLIERAVPEEMRIESLLAEVKADFMNYYMEHKTTLTKPYDGIPELLTYLQSEGIKIAVASNKFIAGTQALISHYFKQFNFAVVLGQREGIPAKPNPTIVNEILSVTGVDKKDVLYLGDTSIDMQTAKNAGVFAIGVSWGFRTKQELLDNGANLIIDHPSELITQIKMLR
ncbi:MAG: HAD family hydrolase [Paludibacteraceae bacterium]|jgi:phosphoglycolate phosphatase|nr:HAD family hydrolase [Paludibacteraceae bacterium]HOH95773.1 HAD family hydrolase [Candidatus Enterocola sp.]